MKKGLVKILVAAILFASALVIGFSSGVFEAASFAAGGRLGAEVLLKLIAMAAGVILAESLVVALLRLLKPENHRLRSVITLISSLLKYIAVIVVLCWGLTIIGVNIMAIVASVGVLALIVGFSAESLIADLVTGLFMLFENLYNVGDIVEIGGFRGTVIDIGIRVTSIADAGENIKIINNADMRNLLNRSDHVSKSIADIAISYNTDLEQLESQLPALLTNIYQAHTDTMLSEPVYLGVQELADSAIVLRFCTAVSEKNIYSVQRILNHDLLLTLRRLDVEIPYPQLDMHSR